MAHTTDNPSSQRRAAPDALAYAAPSPCLTDDAADWAHDDAPNHFEASDLFDALGLAGSRVGWSH